MMYQARTQVTPHILRVPEISNLWSRAETYDILNVPLQAVDRAGGRAQPLLEDPPHPANRSRHGLLPELTQIKQDCQYLVDTDVHWASQPYHVRFHQDHAVPCSDLFVQVYRNHRYEWVLVSYGKKTQDITASEVVGFQASSNEYQCNLHLQFVRDETIHLYPSCNNLYMSETFRI